MLCQSSYRCVLRKNTVIYQMSFNTYDTEQRQQYIGDVQTQNDSPTIITI